MKNIFIPPVSFLVPLIIIAVGLTWACYSIVLKNLNSKDIVFSFSAMAAAFAMFYLNISLSMKDEAQRFVINTHAVLTEDLVIAVSYTHLDVYKRQVFVHAFGGIVVADHRPALPILEPVKCSPSAHSLPCQQADEVSQE